MNYPRLINPLDVLRWTFRRSPADVIRQYDALAGVMRLATGGTSLNFGLWSDSCPDPISAQDNMARHFAGVAGLEGAKLALDAGCGMCGPARLWRREYPGTTIICSDINRNSLGEGGLFDYAINADSTRMPLSDESVDCVMALESAQHFRPLDGFVAEAARILKPGGALAVAIPVRGRRYAARRLGLLRLTWSSERHSAQHVIDCMRAASLSVSHQEMVGRMVYDPLAIYYTKHRRLLRGRILAGYLRHVEALLYRSILDMLKASRQDVIDYMIVKCVK